MIASSLLAVADAIVRLPFRFSNLLAEGPAGNAAAQRSADRSGRRRQQSPPLSNHLRRDIGLPPLSDRRSWADYR